MNAILSIWLYGLPGWTFWALASWELFYKQSLLCDVAVVCVVHC